jgi:hypothetical protein
LVLGGALRESGRSAHGHVTILRVQLSLTASHSIAFLEILRHVQTSAAAASCMEYSARYGNWICHRLYDEYAP